MYSSHAILQVTQSYIVGQRMAAMNTQQKWQTIPINMVGGTKFGRYKKESVEQTWNMIVSDQSMVPYAGYINVLELHSNYAGRGIYSSYRGGFMAVIIGENFYTVTGSSSGTLIPTFIGELSTTTGDVYIAENNNGEICFTDGSYVYVYNYNAPTSPLLVSSNPGTGGNFNFPFSNPTYISFQNGQLIIACSNSTNWVLSGFNAATSWSDAPNSVGSIQSKPDVCQAVVPLPGTGNNVWVFGRNVAELWQYTGAAIFPFQRNSTIKIDYGCINPASISKLKDLVVWISVNENSGPVLMAAKGTQVDSISTDGIDYQLGNLTDPTNCTGFLYQQDGHVLYQFTFPTDNISYAYDFNTQLFSNVSDENLNYHIAREIVYYNNTYYFVSLNGGNIYEFDTVYSYAQYSAVGSTPIVIETIPRIRICPPLRMPTQRYYIANQLYFTVEMGQPNPKSPATAYPSEIINLAVSRDGGQTFGSFVEYDLNPTGGFQNLLNFWQLGIANDSSYQVRYNGYGRWVVCDQGAVNIYG